ncbi:LysR family transcriptional regulator [Alcaligenaceae bacterium]|nr:LysR family transcriptional regulator [Alcaligenaceae bacterium]
MAEDDALMELRQLRYFIAAVEAGSITAAARKLHVVQSAVSRQIANLERELGVDLFLRDKSGVQLTDAGRVLYRHALAATKHVEAARSGIHEMGSEIRGQVSFGIPHSIAVILGLPLLRAVRSELPLVEFTLVEGMSGMLAEQLVSGRLDMSILFEIDALRGFECQPLVSERLHFVSADPALRERLAGAAAISVVDVLDRPLILPPKPNGIRMLMERQVLRSGLSMRVIANLTGVHTMLAAVKAGLGDSVVMAANPEFAGYDKDLLALPIADPEIERPAALYQAESFAPTLATAGVRDIALRLVRDFLDTGKWTGARSLMP